MSVAAAFSTAAGARQRAVAASLPLRQAPRGRGAAPGAARRAKSTAAAPGATAASSSALPTRDKLAPGEAVLVPRSDPVLWGGVGSPGPLSHDQLAAYERDGFILLKGVFDRAAAEEILAEANEFAATCASSGGAEVVREPDSDAIKSIFRPHLLSPSLRAACLHPHTVGVAEQILADHVYVHQSRVNFQRPGGLGFNWHSDAETWILGGEDGMPAMRALSSSLMLEDNSASNGALMVMPGSHHRFAGVGGVTPEKNWETSLRHQTVGTPTREQLAELAKDHGIVHCTGAAGDVLLFDSNIIHGSHSNISPWGRANCFTVFNAVSNRLRDVPNPRPDHLANRGAVDHWTSASSSAFEHAKQ